MQGVVEKRYPLKAPLYLQGLSRKASTDWLQPDAPVLDYANAMVPET